MARHIERRKLLAALGGAAAAWPLAARAQQTERMRRVGVLQNLSPDDPVVQVFSHRLEELGWKEGRNLLIDLRWGAGDVSRLRAEAVHMVRARPDVILTGGSAGLVATQQATRAIPIVFTNVVDPVGQGFIASMARPGGNATGFTNFEFAMGGKWLELLKDMVPRAGRVTLMFNPDNPNTSIFLRSVETAAASSRVETPAIAVRDKAEIENAISALAGGPIQGLIVLPDGLALVHAQIVIGLAARHRLPTIYPFREFAIGGGLVSYGVKLSESYRQAGDYVDRILRGANPADLPVQAPTKFELVINLKTAKALGLDVPLHLQQLADEVIE